MPTTGTTNLATQLIDRKQGAEGTMEFHFVKPPGFRFRPGQNLDMKLLDPPETDEEGNERTFSIVSAPYEDRLTVATRMRDTAFKRSLRSIPLQTSVEIDGPHGNFYLHSDRSRPAFFIAGGIGITPFLSILRQAAHDRLQQDIVLLFSNHRPEDAPFLQELEQLARQNKRFRMTATMTDMNKSGQPWNGPTGLVDREKIHTEMHNLDRPVFYLAGPPGLISAVLPVITELGVSEDDIKFEEFVGY